MATPGTSLGDSWNARMRMIRLRRKRETFRLRDEFRIVPTWLKALCFILYLIALGVGIAVVINSQEARPYDFRDDVGLAALVISAAITAVAIVLSLFLFALAYVNRDAKRRGMNSALWTLIVLLFLPSWGIIGFIIYFLFREPLPYPCPRCGSVVGARFNFCPNCKCNLHPTCPQCKEAVAETDKYCPYCATELPQKNAGALAGGEGSFAPPEPPPPQF